MIFTLEALEAQKGDCLILSWGKTNEVVRHIVIDGGPAGVWASSLSKRLDLLRKNHKIPKLESLPIEMVMVSHIDDDHINGVLEFFSMIEDVQPAVPYRVKTLWYNSFDDILSNGSEELRSSVASLGAEVASGKVASALFGEGEGGRHSAAVVASVNQGRQLRAKAEGLKILMNMGFKGLVMSQRQRVTFALADGLKFHIIAPSLERLTALHGEWEKHVAAHPGAASVASFADQSIANLSSIVVVAEMEGRTMLLTGDARGDDILSGLASSGFIDNAKTGKVHFDVLKMPHHGSNRNMTLDFLQRITADHYVISANGENNNPDTDTVEWIAKARAGESFGLHLTNETMIEPNKQTDVGAAIKTVIAQRGLEAQTQFRRAQDLGLRIDLFDALKF